MAKSNYKKGAISYQFLALPKDVLLSTEYQALPFSSKALMVDLMGQYTGKNNGRLCPSFEVMQRSGWKSKTTLIRAKVALLDCSFVVLTRKGHAPRTSEWIGLTWWKLDYHPGMDIGAGEFPYLNFVRMAMKDPNAGREQPKHNNSVLQKLDRYPANMGLRGPETGPINAAI